MIDSRTNVTIIKEPPFFKVACVRVTADAAATDKDRQKVLDLVMEELKQQLGWRDKRTIHDGISSDCLLGEAALLIAMSGEHPCDRCNHDRDICRGYPRAEERLAPTTSFEWNGSEPIKQ